MERSRHAMRTASVRGSFLAHGRGQTRPLRRRAERPDDLYSGHGSGRGGVGGHGHPGHTGRRLRSSARALRGAARGRLRLGLRADPRERARRRPRPGAAPARDRLPAGHGHTDPALSSEILLLAVLVGAGMLAFWVNVRFPKLLPERRGVLLVHLVASLAGLQVAPALMKFVPGVETLAV